MANKKGAPPKTSEVSAQHKADSTERDIFFGAASPCHLRVRLSFQICPAHREDLDCNAGCRRGVYSRTANDCQMNAKCRLNQVAKAIEGKAGKQRDKAIVAFCIAAKALLKGA